MSYNRVILMGNLTRDPEMSYSKDMPIAKFTVACSRKYKNKDGVYEADYVRCVAFQKTAEFIEKNFKKGSPILVEGSWQTGSFKDKKGDTIYTNECSVATASFAGRSGSNGSSADTSAPTSQDDDFISAPNTNDVDIPFFNN